MITMHIKRDLLVHLSQAFSQTNNTDGPKRETIACCSSQNIFSTSQKINHIVEGIDAVG